MDTVGTFEMAEALAKHGCYTCIHKYKTLKEWRDFAKRCPEALPYTAASSGTADDDFERLNQVLQAIPREWLKRKVDIVDSRDSRFSRLGTETPRLLG